jgi:hypothetical protein
MALATTIATGPVLKLVGVDHHVDESEAEPV